MNVKIIQSTNNLYLETLQQLRYDVYHLPQYLELEAKRTNTIPQCLIITEGEKIFSVPYLLRDCNDLFGYDLAKSEVFDIVSPYGYPGILLNEAAARTPEFLTLAVEQLKSVLSANNVCSAFLRLHPILNDGLNEVLSSQICQVSGETVSVNLSLSEAEIWHQTRSEHRNHINRCKRSGFKAKMVVFEDYVDEFISIYKETMNRVEAKPMYYFDEKYFSSLGKLHEKIHLCVVKLDDQVVCAGIFTECSGILQYHLGGTKNDFLKQAPSKLMFDYVRFWGKERGNEVLHMGGGVGGTQDSLYRFKAGFSKERHIFLTMPLITNEEKYGYLVELQAKALNTESERLLKSNFFPAYRCSSIQ